MQNAMIFFISPIFLPWNNPKKRRFAMSRGSQIAIGITTSMGTVLFAWVAIVGGKNTPIGVAGFLGLSAFFAIVSVACLVKRGRFVTMRITAAGICLALVSGGISEMVDQGFRGRLLGLTLIGVGAGVYSVIGAYPARFPLSQIFGRQRTE
jgi:hypothetical protein